MENYFTEESKRVISRVNIGHECNYMLADYLYYGLGSLYGYAEDVIKSKCKYIEGKNSTFLHLVPTIENVSNYISFIHKQIM